MGYQLSCAGHNLKKVNLTYQPVVHWDVEANHVQSLRIGQVGEVRVDSALIWIGREVSPLVEHSLGAGDHVEDRHLVNHLV